jgi:diguanylate cyclase (GGDEF)-like protein
MISPLPLTAALLLIALLCCFLGMASAMRRGAPGARPFCFLAFACALYAAGSALELSGGTLQRIVFWVKVEYIGILLMEPLWVLYALDFAQVSVPRRGLLALLFVDPLVSLALLWTTELHGLFYSRYWLRAGAPFPLVEIAHGPMYWVHTAAMWIMYSIGVLVLVRYAARSSASVRRSALIALGGMLVPLATNLLMITGATPQGIDVGPFSVIVSVALFAWAISSRRFLDLLPMARERAIESLRDGLVILDKGGKIVDFNPAALAVLGLGDGDAHAELEEALGRPELAALAAKGSGSTELILPLTGGERHLQARAFRVTDDRGNSLGSSLLITDVTETARLVDRLAELASLDGLTGALNRRRFDEVGLRDLELSRRSGAPVGVLMLDLDLFKLVNDERGHQAGDEVLKAVCRRCKGELRATDSFARYGGEEFSVFLPGSDVDGTMAAAERLREVVGDSPIPWEKGGVSVTVSVGAYSSVPGPEDSLEGYLRLADEALYQAKGRGRNRVVFWTASASPG